MPAAEPQPARLHQGELSGRTVHRREIKNLVGLFEVAGPAHSSVRVRLSRRQSASLARRADRARATCVGARLARDKWTRSEPTPSTSGGFPLPPFLFFP